MPKKLEFTRIPQYNRAMLVAELTKLDATLSENAEIKLCGTASVLLQNIDFRTTMDIDFCTRPPETVIKWVDTLWGNSHLFDVNAIGVIGLLCDFEDRLVEVDMGLKHLRVFCLSTRDWIVSKLASPKVDDVLDREDITLEDLLWVQENMYSYGGVSNLRAHSDLDMLIREFERR